MFCVKFVNLEHYTLKLSKLGCSLNQETEGYPVSKVVIDLTSDTEASSSDDSYSSALQSVDNRASVDVNSNLNLLFTPPQCKIVNPDSPSSISSAESWKRAISSPVTPHSSMNKHRIEKNVEKMFASPSSCIRQSVSQIIIFLQNETVVAAKAPYVTLKNHILCPSCRV